jgi:glycerophosphoryl diester phosphodiesterase
VENIVQTSYTGPKRLAHRGITQAAPENTLGAFEAALDSGLEGVEIDVQLSKDGEIIVVHDSNLTRLTLGHPSKSSHNHIVDMTWEDLSKIEIPYANHLLDRNLPPDSKIEFLAANPARIMGQEKGHSYVEECKIEQRMAKLMRLEDFLKWIKKSPRFIAEIEIKAPGTTGKIFTLLEKSDVVSQCIVFSGDEDYLEELQATVAREGKPSGLRLGANIRCLTDEVVKKIKRWDLYEIGLNAECIGIDDLNWFSDHNIQVFSNLGDYHEWWKAVCRMKLSAFKTNYAEAYTQWWYEFHSLKQS